MKSPVDFLMIYPYGHYGVQAPSQRLLLGILHEAGFSVHLLVVSTVRGIQNDSRLRNFFLETDGKSRIIGFSFMSDTYQAVSYLTKLIKSNLSKCVVWGGPHPTISYRRMVGEADAIFVGESDKILPKYVEAVLKNKAFDHLPQIVTQKPNFIPPCGDFFANNLDELPLPFYSSEGQTMILADHIEDDPEYFRNHFDIIHILTSRGCPYHCTYCANSYLRNFIPRGVPFLRKRSVNHVIREICACRQVYCISHVSVEDDAFLTRKDEDLEAFVEEYNRKVDLTINITGITPISLSQRKIKIIRRLPLTSIRVGIQTKSENGLTLYRRKSINKNLEQIIHEYLRDLPKAGVIVFYDFILDSPHETTADKIVTLRFVAGLPKPFFLFLYHLTFYEGTELRTRAIKDGLIDANDQDYYLRHQLTLDDTYINTLFRFVRAFIGYVPLRLMVLLTSSRVLDTPWLQRLLKTTIDAVVGILEKLSSDKHFYRLYRLRHVGFNWSWLRRRYLNFIARVSSW